MSTVEELQTLLANEREKRQQAEAQVAVLQREQDEWRHSMDRKLDALKQDLLQSHEESLSMAATTKEELRGYMVENLEMVETSLENKLKQIFKELLKEENMLAQSQEALKTVVEDAHEELYKTQKTNQEELQSFIMESMELVERGLENRLKEVFDKEGSKLNGSQNDLKEVMLSAHEDSVTQQKGSQQELQNYMVETMELVERALEHKLKEILHEEFGKQNLIVAHK